MLKIQSPLKRKRKKGAVVACIKIGFFAVFVLLGWTVVLPLLGAMLINRTVYGKRVTPMRVTLTYDDYKDVMDRQEMRFCSGKNTLVGYRYTRKGGDRGKALVIVSHGIGCNMDGYLNRTAWFVARGYDVFTFDMTGTCRSGGKGLRGLTQSKIDLHRAIEFCESREEFAGMPVLVYGHSWSGFAAANVLNYGHDELAAVATLSGFNDPWGAMLPHAERYVGRMAAMLRPWSKLAEKLTFGKDASGDGVSGINSYKGPVLVAHSLDDPTVPIESSVYIRRDEIVNPRAEFILYEDRGHTLSRPVAAEKRIDSDYRAGKNALPSKGVNIFQYNVDAHYQFSPKEVVFATDDEFMNAVDDFFTRALARRADNIAEDKNA